MASNKGRIDYKQIASHLAKLAQLRKGQEGYSKSNRHISLEGIASVICTFETFDISVSDHQRSLIVLEAIESLLKSDDISQETLMRAIFTQRSDYMKMELKPYTLLTTISLKRPLSLTKTMVGASEIIFSDTPPNAFERSRQPIREMMPNSFEGSSGFTTVRVKTKARSAYDGFQDCIDKLDYLRGIWNFVLHSRPSVLGRHRVFSPINPIHLGPVHTIHSPRGRRDESNFWYEPDYPPHANLYEVKKWDSFAKAASKLRRRVSGHPYEVQMRQCFVRYARSLDSFNPESSFLKLWGLLEWATAIEPNENYSEVIHRTLFLFGNNDYHGCILEHLRNRRNLTVHHGQMAMQSEFYVRQLYVYVRRVILFHLRTRGKFASPKEFGRALGSSHEIATITNQLVQLKGDTKLRRVARSLRTTILTKDA